MSNIITTVESRGISFAINSRRGNIFPESLIENPTAYHRTIAAFLHHDKSVKRREEERKKKKGGKDLIEIYFAL